MWDEGRESSEPQAPPSPSGAESPHGAPGLGDCHTGLCPEPARGSLGESPPSCPSRNSEKALKLLCELVPSVTGATLFQNLSPWFQSAPGWQQGLEPILENEKEMLFSDPHIEKLCGPGRSDVADAPKGQQWLCLGSCSALGPHSFPNGAAAVWDGGPGTPSSPEH